MSDANQTEMKTVLFVAQDDSSYHGVAELLSNRENVRIGSAKHIAERGEWEINGHRYIAIVTTATHTKPLWIKPDLTCYLGVKVRTLAPYGNGKKPKILLRTSNQLDPPELRSRHAILEEFIERIAFQGTSRSGVTERSGETFIFSSVADRDDYSNTLDIYIQGEFYDQESYRAGRGELKSLSELMAQIVIRSYDAYLANIDSSAFAIYSPVPIPHFPPGISGFLCDIVVTNIKTLPRLDWPLPNSRVGWHVLLGPNASGKTAILRSIAAVLLPGNELGALRQDWRRWVRLGTTQASATITIGPTDAAMGWQIDGETLAKTGHAYDGFSAAYGPFRRFTGGDSEYQREFSAHARLLRHLSLFSERVALSAALDWLKDLEFRLAKGMPEGALADLIKRFVNETELLPDGARLERVDPNGVWFRDANNAEVPADDLSDGYRAVLSLALDLLRHLAVGRAPEDLFTERDGELTVAVEGVVLIDEIDAHLHPTWQQRVGPWFVKRFPRVQFIVATHSAIVCQSADSVLLLPTPGTNDEPRMLTDVELGRLRYGDLIDAYGTGVFGEGVTRSPESRAKLARLASLNTIELERPLTDAERTEQLGLRAVLPSTAFVDGTESDAS